MITTFNSFSNSFKTTKMGVSKNCRPSFTLCVPINSLMSRRIISSNLFIKMVLRMRNNAEIFFSIIKTVSVDVIDKHIIRRLNNKSVHHYVFPFFTGLEFALSVKTVSVLTSVPFPLIKVCKIFIIDNSHFVLRKFNSLHNEQISYCNVVCQQHTDKD